MHCSRVRAAKRSTFDDLLGLVYAALRSDHAAGQRAFAICDDMLSDPQWAPLARSLQRVLTGDPLDQALAELPAAERAEILVRLQAQ